MGTPMRRDFVRWLRPVALSLLLALSAQASPVSVGPPVMVNGEVAPYARVKKNGLIWYPASVVGYYRGISFAYDYANSKLYADGVETLLESVVVDRIVYVNLTPRVSHGDMRPGMNTLALRREHLKAMEGASSHLDGRTDTLFMEENVPQHVHPWAVAPGDRSGPIINLDPTGEEPVAAHMRPGARPPEKPPEALPNRLPRPGESGASSQSTPPERVETVQIPPAEGIPQHVTTQGGPSASTTISQPAAVDPNGLQPIPEPPKETPRDVPFEHSGKLTQSSAQNSVFLVTVLGGTWTAEKKSRILKLKLNQENKSKVAQSNLGSFTVRCADGSRVEASRTRSYLPDGTLDPGGARDGELIFRFSSAQTPEVVELEGALRLTVPLRLQ
ncbi:MAG TPA: hypothetical protein EYO33_06625 [Phycisphaerales bacterium]|nr:hypothetical protein [Phycisphaerales bacterium]